MSILVLCLECGAKFSDGYSYCPQCGETNIEPAMEDDPFDNDGEQRSDNTVE